MSLRSAIRRSTSSRAWQLSAYKYTFALSRRWKPFCSSPDLPFHGPDCAVWRGWHRERRFVIFQRWLAAEHFVPAALYHMNIMSEFMG